MLVSGVTVTGGLDMASRTLVCFGLLPVATTRHVMSLSVITPMTFMLSSFSTTGISPQSCFTIISAACCTLCSGVQQAGLALIMSFAFFMGLLLWIEIVSNRNSYLERLRRVTSWSRQSCLPDNSRRQDCLRHFTRITSVWHRRSLCSVSMRLLPG